MSDDQDETTSTVKGTESNKEVGQTPDQFFDPLRDLAERSVDPPKNHATKGMTVLGDTEASRVQDGQE